MAFWIECQARLTEVPGTLISVTVSSLTHAVTQT